MSARRGIRPALVLTGLAVALLLVAVAALCAGAVPLTPSEGVGGLFGGAQSFLVQEYRLPRVLVSLLAGAALAVGGVLLQAAVRNPLASPDVIGVTKGAALGAMLATSLTPIALQAITVPLGVLLGAALVTVALLVAARRLGTRGRGGATLALVGIAISAIAAAGVEYLMTIFPRGADQAMVWLAGSVHSASLHTAALLGGWLAVCLPFVLAATALVGRAGFDDTTLLGIGRTPLALRGLLVAVATALSAGAVAAVGGIGFIGLLAPHAAALLLGPGRRLLVPAAALAGAVLLCAADLLGRLVVLPNEVPAGIVAAVVGGPMLLVLLIREIRPHAR